MAQTSMAEHSDILLTILGFVMALGVMETLRRLYRIEKKQDEQVETHAQCRATLMSKEDFKTWFNEWREGRCALWDALNKHTHDSHNGKVIRE